MRRGIGGGFSWVIVSLGGEKCCKGFVKEKKIIQVGTEGVMGKGRTDAQIDRRMPKRAGIGRIISRISVKMLSAPRMTS